MTLILGQTKKEKLSWIKSLWKVFVQNVNIKMIKSRKIDYQNSSNIWLPFRITFLTLSDVQYFLIDEKINSVVFSRLFSIVPQTLELYYYTNLEKLYVIASCKIFHNVQVFFSNNSFVKELLLFFFSTNKTLFHTETGLY